MLIMRKLDRQKQSSTVEQAYQVELGHGDHDEIGQADHED